MTAPAATTTAVATISAGARARNPSRVPVTPAATMLQSTAISDGGRIRVLRAPSLPRPRDPTNTRLHVFDRLFAHPFGHFSLLVRVICGRQDAIRTKGVGAACPNCTFSLIFLSVSRAYASY